MYIKKMKTPYKHVILHEIKDMRGIENPTGEQVLEHLFGDYDGWVRSKYTVKVYDHVETNFIQRINALWVYPCYAIFIAPIKWVVTGHMGVETETKAYKFLRFLLGKVS